MILRRTERNERSREGISLRRGYRVAPWDQPSANGYHYYIRGPVKLHLENKVPSTYNRASWMDVVRDIQNNVNPLLQHFKGFASEVPTIGAYARCDWYQNSLPSPSGPFGFVCVESGAPGVWKQFGQIL